MVNTTNQFFVNKADFQHLGQVFDLFQDFLETATFPAWPESKLETCINSPDMDVFIYLQQQVLLGSIVTHYTDQSMLIELLAVHNQHRRKGIGSLLLRHSIDAAVNMGLNQACVHVQAKNSNAISFYKKHLFQKTATIPRYYAGIDSAVMMVKSLINNTTSD